MWDLIIHAAKLIGFFILIVYVILPLLITLLDLLLKVVRRLTGSAPPKKLENHYKEVYTESMHWMNTSKRR